MTKKLPMVTLDDWCNYTCKDECCTRGAVFEHEQMSRIQHIHTTALAKTMRHEAVLQWSNKGTLWPRTAGGNKPWSDWADGYCVFWNNGCVLRKHAAEWGFKREELQPPECIRYPLKKLKDEKRVFKWVPCSQEREIDLTGGDDPAVITKD